MASRVALLIGLFVAPAVLLWLGQRLRDASATRRGAFWGGITGHTLALVATALAAMAPPIVWTGGGLLRELVVHWSLVAGAVVGTAIGAAAGLRRG